MRKLHAASPNRKPGKQRKIAPRLETVISFELINGQPECFVIVAGVKIAQRGQPDTPHAMTWISLEPGWSVYDDPYPDRIVIEGPGTPAGDHIH
jgi:hypothetical protein